MSRAELLRGLAALAEPPHPDHRAVAAALGLPRVPTSAEHTDLLTFQLHPYASVHLGPEGQLGGVARDRVAGFLRALGAVPPAEPDHLVVLLLGYAELVELATEGVDRAVHARVAMLHEHLWPWIPRFALRATELGSGPYPRWGVLLGAALTDEHEAVGPAPVLPAHLREAPGMPDPDEVSSADLLQALVAPARSGLILARADLARIASQLGAGLRVGERVFTLRALLAQQPTETLAALAAEAERQREQVPGRDPTAVFWRDRLAATASLLTDPATTRIDALAGR